MWGKAASAGLEAGLSVAIGILLGYYADRWLGTGPVLLIVFLFLGFFAGMRRLLQIRWVPEETPASEEPGESCDGNHSNDAPGSR